MCSFHKEDRRRCTHMYADGKQCEALPIHGAEVCISHGGQLPSTQKAARLRLLSMVEPALNCLERAMDAADWPVATRAAVAILDRAGFGPMMKVTVDGVQTSEYKELSDSELENRALQVLERVRQRQLANATKQLVAAQDQDERMDENTSPDDPEKGSYPIQ